VGRVSEWIGTLTGTYPPLNREKAREILEAALMCSSDKAREDLGYTPSVKLEEGIRETLTWYREQGWI
jgi:nucleoside-diphosphate-sugar epimerase